jgi:two-component system KDP operon response regulator KdpE
MTPAVLLSSESGLAVVLRATLESILSDVVVVSEEELIPADPREPFVFVDLSTSADDRVNVVRSIVAARGAAPIIVLAWPEQTSCVVAALNAGASDVAWFPNIVRDILARVRRVARLDVNVRPIQLNAVSKTVRLVQHGRTVQLGSVAFAMLDVLASAGGQLLTVERIAEAARGHGLEVDRKDVRGLMRELVATLEVDPRRPDLIVAESSVGYRLVGN